MATTEPSTFVPAGRGRAALADLDRVAWRELAHAKFGVGLVLRREDDKVRVRFADGVERLLASRFVTKADRPG